MTDSLAGARGALVTSDTGIAAKRPVFGGSCKVCPWGAIAEIVRAAMRPYGFDVLICYNCFRSDAPRIVAGAKMPPRWKTGMVPGIIADSDIPPPPNGPVDFGATSLQTLWWAYQGTHHYSGESPRQNLRLIATIESPNYLIVAVKADLGITDLSQIRNKRWPVRVLIDVSDLAPAVLANYGLTKQSIEAAGGHVANGIDPDERKNFDVIIYGGTLANAPEFNVWYEVSQKYDLTYLQLPDALLDELARDCDMQRHDIPNGLLRGIHRPIPTVTRSGHAVYGRDDMPDDFAYTVAKALDEHQDLLQWSLINLSYNPKTVWKAFGVPLHPGATRYYRERGYLH